MVDEVHKSRLYQGSAPPASIEWPLLQLVSSLQCGLGLGLSQCSDLMWPSIPLTLHAGRLHKPAPTPLAGLRGGEQRVQGRGQVEQLSFLCSRTRRRALVLLARASQGSVQSNGVEQQSGALLRAPGVPPLPLRAVPRCARLLCFTIRYCNADE